MKKKIIITILTILILGCLGCGSYFYLSNNSNNNNQQKEEKPIKELPEESEENLIEAENIIDKYLSYVPLRNTNDYNNDNMSTQEIKNMLIDYKEYITNYEPDMSNINKDSKNDAYSNEYTTINDIDNKLLYEMTYNDESIKESLCTAELDECSVKKIEDINKVIKERYNIEPKSESYFFVPAGIAIKNTIDNTYIKFAYKGGNNIIKLNKIINSRYEDNQLIIDETVLFIVEDSEQAWLYLKSPNNPNNIKFIEELFLNNIDNAKEYYEKYFNENIDKLSSFRHTFKQHEDGTYYWYSTELLK